MAPEKILVLTFTRASAGEMRERFLRRAGEAYPVTFGTFHSVFYHILQAQSRLSSQNLLTGEARKQLLREAVGRAGSSWDEDVCQTLLAEIGLVGNWSQPLEQYQPKEYLGEDFQKIYQTYEALKRDSGLFDLDDLQRLVYEMFCSDGAALERWGQRFSFYLVDEVQDMNPLQWEILYLMAAPDYNIFAVGDDDQAIYGFRGSKPECMMEFYRRFPRCGRIDLGTNYRCPASVVEMAGRLISHNRQRFTKELSAVGDRQGAVRQVACPSGEAQDAYIADEIRKWRAKGYAYGDMAVLCRNHRQSLGLLRRCQEAMIPVSVQGRIGNPYRHWVVRDLEAYLRMAAVFESKDALRREDGFHKKDGLRRKDALRIMNRPVRYLSRAGVEREPLTFAAWSSFYRGQPWMQERIRLLESQVRAMASMTGFSAVNYIRKGIGYDGFLREYAGERGGSEKELLAQADVLSELARGTVSVRQLLEKLERARELAEQWGGGETAENEGVRFYTLHGAKGLEFPVVFIPDVNEGVLPSAKANTAAAIEEERRLCYVGMTRAKEALYLCYISGDNRKKAAPSRFLSEMQEEAAIMPAASMRLPQGRLRPTAR